MKPGIASIEVRVVYEDGEEKGLGMQPSRFDDPDAALRTLMQSLKYEVMDDPYKFQEQNDALRA